MLKGTKCESLRVIDKIFSKFPGKEAKVTKLARFHLVLFIKMTKLSLIIKECRKET